MAEDRIQIGTKIHFGDDVGKVIEFLEEPNSGLCLLEIEARGVVFDLPVDLLEALVVLREERDERDAIIESQLCQGCDKNRLALAEALIPFTHHKIPCPFVTLLEEYKGGVYKCTCGLDEAIDSASMGKKPERCECGADAEKCKQNRAWFGVHLESGCGIRKSRD